MSLSAADKRAKFRQLHESGCFVIPNPWDVGSAVMLEHLGFKALATTSAGMAWSLGRPGASRSSPSCVGPLPTVWLSPRWVEPRACAGP